MKRTHAVASTFCAICGARDATVGSSCVVPKMPSAGHVLAAAQRRRDIIATARATTVDGLVIEAAHDGWKDDARHVTLYTDAEEAQREHGADIILTGDRNERTQ